MASFKQGASELAITLLEYGQTGSHADARLQVRATAHGFSGSCEAQFLLPDLLHFARSLQTMQRSGQGEASLYSLSPHEVELHIAYNDAGLAVRGSFGNPVDGSAGRQYWHALSFGFDCARSELSNALDTDWLRDLLQG
ncbi:hypothetical protein V8J88_02325 [Massilia sp. W12]|uniref:WapI family immunity protein n=1 Tax=Massilia sp. W12 TaxID=3126507 RepID=UPI0030CCE3AC